MKRTIYRARCQQCGTERRVPDNEGAGTECMLCGYDVPGGWERWEMDEVTTFAASVIDAEGYEHGCGTWPTLAEPRHILRPGGNFVQPGEKTRIVKTTTRTLRRVK